MSGVGKWDSGTGIWDWGTGIFERGENEASKDIAESPARSERPDKDNSQRTTDNRQRFQDTETPRIVIGTLIYRCPFFVFNETPQGWRLY